MTEKNEITRKDVAHVAGLAKLQFSATELDKFTKQFEDIIALADTLNEVTTDGVEPTFSVTDQFNVMREDIAVQANQKDALLANAPETEDGYIKVPAIIDESEEG